MTLKMTAATAVSAQCPCYVFSNRSCTSVFPRSRGPPSLQTKWPAGI